MKKQITSELSLKETLIRDLTAILLRAEAQRTRRELNYINRREWCNVSIRASAAILEIAKNLGIELNPRTIKLVLDSLQATYRNCKAKSLIVLSANPPIRESTIQKISAEAASQSWCSLTIKAAIVLSQAMKKASEEKA